MEVLEPLNRDFIAGRFQASLPRQEREIALPELKPGMTLAAGVKTLSGMLLVPEGQVLNEAQVEAIHNHHRMKAVNPVFLVFRD
jgi:hypothetical protein